jgi:hypothetical protein
VASPKNPPAKPGLSVFGNVGEMCMGKVYSELNDQLRELIEAQHVFFVATSPTSPEAHLNLSPKGLDSFLVLDAKTVAYLDLVGSGIETVSHLRENGRIVIMFCEFTAAPKIVRLYGRGRVVEPQDAEWQSLAPKFPDYLGARSIIVVELERVADSCGWGVPHYEYAGERTQLVDYCEQQGSEKLAEYKQQKNGASIDGLPGLRSVTP